MSDAAKKVLADALQWTEEQHDGLQKRIAEDRETLAKNEALLADLKKQAWGIRAGLQKLDPHADDYAKAV